MPVSEMVRSVTIHDWLQAHPLSVMDLDCITTIKLKIMDGNCKMNLLDKQVISRVYQAINKEYESILGDDIHEFIVEHTDSTSDEARTLAVYETRLLAETKISRPVMKAFKARIRARGIYELDLGIPSTGISRHKLASRSE